MKHLKNFTSNSARMNYLQSEDYVCPNVITVRNENDDVCYTDDIALSEEENLPVYNIVKIENELGYHDGYVSEQELGLLCDEDIYHGGTIPSSSSEIDATVSIFTLNSDIIDMDCFKHFTGLVSVGKNAFSGCKNLERITLPSQVENIDDYAFFVCSGLTSINIPSSVEGIGKYAFFDCLSLTGITIPDSVTSIGEYAFYDCSSLTNITYNGTIVQWNAITKGTSWHHNVPSTTVVTCTDGTVALD